MQAQALLSAYYDNELEPELGAAIAEHLTHCSTCASAVAGYQDLSRLAQALPVVPGVPDWSDLEKRRNARSPRASGTSGAWNVSRSALAAAAAVLLMVGITLVARQPWKSSGGELATLDRYFDAFAESPAAGREVLSANYQAREVDVRHISQFTGFTPAAATPPASYQVASTCVLDMPCGRCPLVTLQRPDGSQVAIMECEEGRCACFSNRPITNATCCGKPTEIVQGRDQLLAAIWHADKRRFTVVGARDLQEITELVAHFEKHSTAEQRDTL
jgi:hypothetical protein